MTFKAGDKIRCTNLGGYKGPSRGGFTIGREYIVSEAHTTSYGERFRTVRDDDGLPNGWLSEYFELVEELKPTSNPFSWSGAFRSVDPDLQREGYHEECSEYRACQNERGDWIVEATRKKIIAQAANETEANRIAAALNITTISN